MSETLLEVKGLTKHYVSKKGLWGAKKTVRAVNGIDLTLYNGEVVSIVGESGCGKSTLGRCVLRLIEPSAGSVHFEGSNILEMDNKSLRAVKRDMQFVFQDPYASLNPRSTVEDILMVPLEVHRIGDKIERRQKVQRMMDIVGLSKQHLKRYPHEFSGGQRQRIGIARALILQPKLIIADEPVSALDVSVQAQILNLMQDLKEEFKLTYMFISHDLSVVRHISDRVAVMYLGKIVEIADKNSLYSDPQHPYTKALLSSVPVPDPEAKKERILLEGDVPSPSNPPSGCTFHTRCPFAFEACKTVEPTLKPLSDERMVACHLLHP
ncbi:peptide/nickel transport system ATP-binding protein [Paenibacillus sp. yr247]|uniref:ABC transporter ATP-binding protein n=1 Tax=Paenibacillus sp. yr247 TaxID=1761880 RepID=UPI000892201E|nr:dipeptide ABC transporter ATP-binding protein [Paenibacillus sp. yr247]SDN94647.1 peptide/nickel transport system ATP-binding protein [Paenibacillus sp. yr247]